MKVTCAWVRERQGAFLDRSLVAADREMVRTHLRSCPGCTRQLEAAGWVKNSMRALPRLSVPGPLTTSLRVIASRERARQLRWRTAQASLATVRSELALWFNNLMKPLAIPAAGGIMTAGLLFATFISAYPGSARTVGSDVPTPIYTGATFKGMVPVEFTSGEVIVDLFIDEQGRVLNFKFVAGDPALERTVENMLLYTEFHPARSFGQPVSGKVRYSFRRGAIEVRG